MSENQTSNTPRRVKRGWMNLRVKEIIDETPDTKTYILVDAEDGGRCFDYRPGQYLTFRYDQITDKPVVRSYTMSSSPCQPDHVAFTVKKLEGGLVTEWMFRHIERGSVLRARGPIGIFCYNAEKDHPHLFMVAAGSGVTPFTSIIREHATSLGKSGSPKKMTLLVSFRSKVDLINWSTLQEAKAKGLELITTLSREQATDEGFWHGRIDEAQLEQAFAQRYQDVTVMTCGPEAMMEMVTNHAKAHGIAEDQVKTESF